MNKSKTGARVTERAGKPKDVIGRWVCIDMPRLGLYNVRAKVDTGAYRSTLHCDFIEEFKDGDDTYLKVRMTDLAGHPFSDNVTLKQERTAKVKSSNGETQKRPIVRLDVTINGESHRTEFSLSNRSDMKFPILLGRKFLRNKFLVDVSLDIPDEGFDEEE